MRKLFLIISICFLLIIKVKCQSDIGKTISVLPSVKIGYNFGAGIDFGAHLGLTFFNYTISNTGSNSGIDVGYDYFFGHTYLKSNNKGRFRTVSVNVINTTNNQAIVKLGISKTSVKWGLGNRNNSHSKGWGYNVDLSYSPLKNGIFIGYNMFQVNNSCMGLGMKHSNIIYAAYEYPIAIKTHKQVSLELPYVKNK